MSNNADEIVVAQDGSINVAPYGTTLPTLTSSPTSALNAAFKEMGYASEDGVSFSVARDIVGRRVWQSKSEVRRDEQGRDETLAMVLVQWNEDTMREVFGGGEVENTALNVFVYTPPAPGESLREVSVAIDWQDGDKDYRLLIPKATVDGDVEITLNAQEMAGLPFGLKALYDDVAGFAWRVISDDPSFVGAGS